MRFWYQYEYNWKILSKISKIEKFNHYYIFNEKIKKGISKNLNVKRKIINNSFNLKIEKKIDKMPPTNYFPKKTKNILIINI